MPKHRAGHGAEIFLLDQHDKDAAITVVPAEGRRLMRDFHRLPHRLYRNDPNWVPPLFLERQIHFDRAHNPFFQHAKAAYWLALRDGEPVGRITAQIDALHLKQHNDATGHFGFIEGEDDPAVFKALIETAEGWLRAEGMRRVFGPVSFSMWDEPGLLVEGFERPPSVLMGHALPYYERRIVERGYEPVQDLLAYEIPVHGTLPPAVRRLMARGQKQNGFRVRPIRNSRKDLPAEITLLHGVLNESWQDNWGFVPMTREEVDEIVQLFRLLLRPDAISIAEYNGEPVAFSMMIPNLNEAIRDLGGRLLPFGFLKLLWRFKVRGLRSGRLALMGVRRKWWSSPVGAVAAVLAITAIPSSEFARTGVQAEMSWILDSNERIKRVLKLFGCTITKRYRIYGRNIA